MALVGIDAGVKLKKGGNGMSLSRVGGVSADCRGSGSIARGDPRVE
jgi:hypothetical protein